MGFETRRPDLPRGRYSARAADMISVLELEFGWGGRVIEGEEKTEEVGEVDTHRRSNVSHRSSSVMCRIAF